MSLGGANKVGLPVVQLLEFLNKQKKEVYDMFECPIGQKDPRIRTNQFLNKLAVAGYLP